MLKKLLALSRTTHGVLDLAMAGFAALLWLGHFPSLDILIVSLATALAGYTAIYALNDLLGAKQDRAKLDKTGIKLGYAVEASDYRYPLAQGILNKSTALVWFGFWFFIALVGTWWLNPKLWIIVFLAAILEAIYCKLLTVSYWRIVVSGLVKSLGPVAAVFVVVPAPHLGLLAIMIIWLMAWEIGGQNIPADWNDVEQDRAIGAKTMPVIFGTKICAIIICIANSTALIFSLLLPLLSPLPLGWPYLALSLSTGIYLLAIPSYQLLLKHQGQLAVRLFNRASLYPVAHLAIILIFVGLEILHT